MRLVLQVATQQSWRTSTGLLLPLEISGSSSQTQGADALKATESLEPRKLEHWKLLSTNRAQAGLALGPTIPPIKAPSESVQL